MSTHVQGAAVISADAAEKRNTHGQEYISDQHKKGGNVMSTIIVCGLTDYENKIIKEHKGECKYCMHNESFMTSRNTLVRECSKKGPLYEFKTDCKDWMLDTR